MGITLNLGKLLDLRGEGCGWEKEIENRKPENVVSLSKYKIEVSCNSQIEKTSSCPLPFIHNRKCHSSTSPAHPLPELPYHSIPHR